MNVREPFESWRTMKDSSFYKVKFIEFLSTQVSDPRPEKPVQCFLFPNDPIPLETLIGPIPVSLGDQIHPRVLGRN